jgi:hypothetical protein
LTQALIKAEVLGTTEITRPGDREPATLGMLGLGLAGIRFARRKKQSW